MRRFLAAALVMVSSAYAQLPFTDNEYDEDIPTLEEVVGHENGAEITAPDEVIRYMETLAEAAPERMRLVEYARSWEDRPLVYAVIGAPQHIERLDRIKADLNKLSDGRSLDAEARDDMVDRLPAVTWLAYGVHGDEISSSDAALALSYHLLAVEGDERVDEILENTIVIIDPMQNPDGRARFVNSFEAARGLETQDALFAAERDQPWPGGRYNHALFDMNRDWFALTQPETRGKVSAVVEWNPVVVVDAHEMGSDETYFFPPAARPFSPQLTENSKEGQAIVGRENARAFDEAGISYFTREVFDNFYPGYGDMWPALRGAVAMTYEQASARGLAAEQDHGEPLTYATGVRNHFLATLTTAATVARNKERFLSAYADDRAAAVAEGEEAEDRYTVLNLSERAAQARALAERLTLQGIEVRELAPGGEACGTTYEDGAIVVDKAQPSGRLVRTLMATNTPLAKDFIIEQEERRKAGLGHELYDVTAWSLPLMEGLSSTTCAEISETEAFDPEREKMNLAAADFGYAVPWSDAGQARLVIAALKAGLRGKASGDSFVQEGETFPRGTVVFAASLNGDNLRTTLAELMNKLGGTVIPMATSWVDEGPNFGSDQFFEVTMPKVAMAWGAGTSPLSAGATRHVLERQLGLPVTPIRMRSMAYADLARFDAVFVPELGRGSNAMLGARGRAALKEYAEEGGTLVGFGSALGMLSSEDVGLLPLMRETSVPSKGAAPKKEAEGSTQPGTELWSEEDYQTVIDSGEGYPDRVPGVLVKASGDPNHILSAGYDEAIVLFRGNTIYAPLKDDQGTNVFRYLDAEELLASGYLWDDVRNQLARKPFVVARPVGQGMVIGFAQDPTVRGYLGGLNLLLANSAVLAPAQ